MAPLPRVREILQAVVGTAPSSVKAIVTDLNTFMRDVVRALDSGLTVSENLAQCWVDVRYAEGSTPPLVPLPSLKAREPHGVTVEAIEVLSGALSGPVWVDWEKAGARGGSALRLRAVYGLGAGATVNLRLLVKAE